MGHALLFESMFDTVIERATEARGAILPDVAVLHVAGFGRNATSCRSGTTSTASRCRARRKPLRKTRSRLRSSPRERRARRTDSREIRRLDPATVAARIRTTAAEVALAARTDGVRGDEAGRERAAGAGEGRHGAHAALRRAGHDAGGRDGARAVLWFDTLLRADQRDAGRASTSLHERQTHQAQTMLHFPEPIALNTPGGCETARETRLGRPARSRARRALNPAAGHPRALHG